MISLIITVIECEDIDETVQGSSYVSELEDRNMLSVVCGLIDREYPLAQMHWLAHSHVQAVLGSIHSLQLLKVFPSITDIDESGCRCWKRRDVDHFILDSYILHRTKSWETFTYEWMDLT